MSDTQPQNFPPATSEVSKLFGMQDNTNDHTLAPHAIGSPIADLPMEEAHHAAEDAHGSAHHLSPVEEKISERHQKDSHGGHDNTFDDHTSSGSAGAVGVIITILPYLIIFVVGIFLYLFFFSKVDFSALFKSTPAAVSVKESALQKLEKQNLASYQAWIKSFYYDISDQKLLDPNVDNSGNGLSNFQKYLLNLNPKSYDTLGLGMADSEALSRNINPLSGAPLTDAQKQVIDKYFDMEVITNRLALAKLQKSGGQVAGATTSTTSGQSVPNYQNNQTQQSQAQDVLNANDIAINTDIPGRLEIPSLNESVPVIWSKDPATFEQDLKSGVIHYPGTALPGQIGTSYISGHSSNYAWVKGNYNRVFTKLNNIPDNGSFKITVVQQNGKDAILHYVVTGRKEYEPNDIAQFQNGGTSVVALSTCWPIGSTAKRLVLFGQLTQVEK